MMDSRTTLWMDIAFYIRTALWPLLKSLCKIHALWSTNNIGRSSYQFMGNVMSTVGGEGLQSEFQAPPVLDLPLTAACRYMHISYRD